MASLEPALAQSGFRLVVAYLPPDPQAASTSSPQVASARITSLLQFGIAGLVVCPSESLVLPKITCPAIIVGRPRAGLPAVYEDEAEGGRRLARRLLEKGHRHVAILRDAAPTTQQPSNLATASSRTLAGFLDACAQGGATTLCFNSVAEFLPVAESVTAVFCGSSAVLLELYSRGLPAGLRLGSSLAVVAVDHLGVAAHLVPRPTVLKPGGTQLGQAAARLLQQAIEGSVPGDVRLEPVLVDGDSMPEAPIQSTVAKPPIVVTVISRTGDTPVTTGASRPLAVVAAVPGGTEPESASPVAETEVTQALVSDEEINPHPNPLPSQGEGVSLPQDTAISPSEALQMPEAASDVPTEKVDN
jgi:DNA-binding LacI/PurR family transcriptional regulator